MRYGDVCSGISAPTAAWKPLGWKAQWFSEIEKFPSAVLAHHYPDVPNLGDMTRLSENKIYNESIIDILVGGTPCQSFSIAGLRGGLDDERGNLALEYCRVLKRKRPRWFLWENVPGVLTSGKNEDGSKCSGKDFASILSAWTGRDIAPQKFEKSGVIQGDFYSVAWRVLDAQYFGVPQRRRRVFVVGHLGGDWRPPFAVLFERESLRGDIKKSGKKRQKITGEAGEDADTGGERAYGGTTAGSISVAQALSTKNQRNDFETETLIAHSIDCRNLETNEEISGTLQAKKSGGYSLNYTNPVIYDTTQATHPANGSNPQPGDPCHPLPSNGHAPLLTDSPQAFTASGQSNPPGWLSDKYPTILAHQPGETSNLQYGVLTSVVRRLTPLECERLQGFPDHFTNIPKATDGARYKALGNSMAVSCIEWIGRRIEFVDKLLNNNR